MNPYRVTSLKSLLFIISCHWLRRSGGIGHLVRTVMLRAAAASDVSPANNLAVLVLLPEILLALGQPRQPRRQNATGDLVRPGLLHVLIRGNDATARDLFNNPDGRVQHNVRADAANQAVGNGVGKRHEGDGDEGGDAVAQVLPVDLGDVEGHHAAHQNQHAAGGPGRDGGEDGREEDGDEEADAGRHGCQARFASLADTRAGLDKGGDWGRAKEGADGDADGVDHVTVMRLVHMHDTQRVKMGHAENLRNGRPFEILSDGVHDVGILRHGVQRTRAVQDINVEESDQGQTELTTVRPNVPLLHIQRPRDRMESHDLLEEVEIVITLGRVGEVCDISAPRPGDDGYQNDAVQDRALDAVHHQQRGQDAATENANPHPWVAHLARGRAKSRVRIPQRIDAARQLHGSVRRADHEADTFRVREADERQEQADAHGCSELDGLGNGARQPLTHTEQGESEEDPALNEDGCESNLVGNGAGAVIAYHCVGEVGIETHAGGDADGPESC